MYTWIKYLFLHININFMRICKFHRRLIFFLFFNSFKFNIICNRFYCFLEICICIFFAWILFSILICKPFNDRAYIFYKHLKRLAGIALIWCFSNFFFFFTKRAIFIFAKCNESSSYIIIQFGLKLLDCCNTQRASCRRTCHNSLHLFRHHHQIRSEL